MIVCDYTQTLIEKLNSVHGNVSAPLPLPAKKPTHPFLPGDTVLVKSLNPRKVGKEATMIPFPWFLLAIGLMVLCLLAPVMIKGLHLYSHNTFWLYANLMAH